MLKTKKQTNICKSDTFLLVHVASFSAWCLNINWYVFHSSLVWSGAELQSEITTASERPEASGHGFHRVSHRCARCPPLSQSHT